MHGRQKFVLVGVHAGKTIDLGNHSFVNGVAWACEGTRRDTSLEVVARAMSRYGAFIEGSLHQIHAQKEYDKAVQGISSNEETPPFSAPPPKGLGKEPEFEQFFNKRLVAAIQSLDPKKNGLWTQAGLPSLPAIEAAYHQGGLNRKMVNEALPGWNRKQAYLLATLVATDSIDYAAKLQHKAISRQQE